MRLWVVFVLIVVMIFVPACQAKKSGPVSSASPGLTTSPPVQPPVSAPKPVVSPGETGVTGVPAPKGPHGGPPPDSPYQKKKEQLQQLLNSGNLEEAESVAKEALELAKTIFPPDHSEVAITINDLANIYSRQGKTDEAIKYYEQALAIREKHADTEASGLAVTLQDLGNLYSMREETRPKAEEYYLRALKMKEKVGGAESSDLILTLNALGEFYRQEKRYSEAEPYLLRAMNIAETRPDASDNLPTIMKNLGSIYADLREDEKAEKMLKNALSAYDRMAQEDTQAYLEREMVLSKLIEVYERMNSPELENTKKKLIEVEKKLLGLYKKEGREEEAISCQERLEILEGLRAPAPAGPGPKENVPETE
ncbi:MAG: tetratricopeptide repeat protein [Candidatus Eremiobacteraeota bacterium]|nr:tetratricopeptide repeat protein [Candidatus Eremiobacteraeota bacterium]